MNNFLTVNREKFLKALDIIDCTSAINQAFLLSFRDNKLTINYELDEYCPVSLVLDDFEARCEEFSVALNKLELQRRLNVLKTHNVTFCMSNSRQIYINKSLLFMVPYAHVLVKKGELLGELHSKSEELIKVFNTLINVGTEVDTILVSTSPTELCTYIPNTKRIDIPGYTEYSFCSFDIKVKHLEQLVSIMTLKGGEVSIEVLDNLHGVCTLVAEFADGTTCSIFCDLPF